MSIPHSVELVSSGESRFSLFRGDLARAGSGASPPRGAADANATCPRTSGACTTGPATSARAVRRPAASAPSTTRTTPAAARRRLFPPPACSPRPPRRRGRRRGGSRPRCGRRRRRRRRRPARTNAGARPRAPPAARTAGRPSEPCSRRGCRPKEPFSFQRSHVVSNSMSCSDVVTHQCRINVEF